MCQACQSLLFNVTERQAPRGWPLGLQPGKMAQLDLPLGNKPCTPFTAGSLTQMPAPWPPCHDQKRAEENWCPARPPDDHNPGSRCKQQEHRALIYSNNALKWLPIIFISEHSHVFS